MQDVDLNEPTGWRVSAISGISEFITEQKPEVHSEVFPDRAAAETYRDHLKAEGWVATVTPEYASPQQRAQIRARDQARVAPRGFSKDWCLHQDHT